MEPGLKYLPSVIERLTTPKDIVPVDLHSPRPVPVEAALRNCLRPLISGPHAVGEQDLARLPLSLSKHFDVAAASSGVSFEALLPVFSRTEALADSLYLDPSQSRFRGKSRDMFRTLLEPQPGTLSELQPLHLEKALHNKFLEEPLQHRATPALTRLPQFRVTKRWTALKHELEYLASATRIDHGALTTAPELRPMEWLLGEINLRPLDFTQQLRWSRPKPRLLRPRLNKKPTLPTLTREKSAASPLCTTQAAIEVTPADISYSDAQCQEASPPPLPTGVPHALKVPIFVSDNLLQYREVARKLSGMDDCLTLECTMHYHCDVLIGSETAVCLVRKSGPATYPCHAAVTTGQIQ